MGTVILTLTRGTFGGVVTSSVAGVRHKPDLLDFLIDRLLKKFVKLLAFVLHLGNVSKFDFDGGTETVAAERRESQLLAVVGR